MALDPRDVFDGLLVGAVLVVLYARVVGPGIAVGRVRTVVDTLLTQDLVVYLVLAGVLGVAFIGYITVYLPRNQGGDA